MTTQEKIEVMKGYTEGKKIQWKFKDCPEWDDCTGEPSWNWLLDDFRIKPEEKYRPYKNTEEMIEDFKKRFGVEVPPYAMPMIWVEYKPLKERKLITGFKDKVVVIAASVWGIDDLFEDYTYLDGSPCGKLEASR